ncbi:MAG: amidohydrolase [Rhodospirillaceae bacterium]|nr:amidohydrolase [Rhodospirillaceae bacterium]
MLATVSAVALMLAAPAHAQFSGSAAGKRLADMPRDPFPSTYAPLPSVLTAIVGATAHTGTGATVNNATVVMSGGKIVSVTEGGAVPAGAVVIDGKGKYVTPGLIDAHSHLGVYPEPSVDSLSDGNEATDPNTAEVWAEHSLWPQDPAFSRALAGGVTAMQILPGSANLIGGRSVVVKNVWSRSVQGMKFPGAKQGMKMACGENPRRVYGSKNRTPATRMGNFAGYRAAWLKALEYQYEWDQFEAKRQKGDPAAKPPKRDLELETLAGALRGDILVQMHCYRADEMMQVLDMAREFGYRVSQFHHAVEAYKIRDVLARENVCGSMWSDWWGFKIESLDGIVENIALMDAAGACAVLHSDSNVANQRLNQDAAKAMAAGRRAGLTITEGQAIKWVTLNPAKSIAIDDKTGSLEPGKMADVVIWSGSPLSVYSHAEKVFIDGALTYDYDDPGKQARGDFELGVSNAEDVR